jgi:translation initiation factor RLI1
VLPQRLKIRVSKIITIFKTFVFSSRDRFAIAAVVVQKADVYMFDEPSSYLDVKQRLKAATTIRSVVSGEEGLARYVLVVEHDLAVLDYLSGEFHSSCRHR